MTDLSADPLAGAFAALYGAPPTHLVRAPGRVNLIGEHIDYAGLPVFPMAIQRQITIALRPVAEPECRIATDEPGLEPRRFRLDRVLEPYPAGDWGNYVKAAAVFLRERRQGRGNRAEPPGTGKRPEIGVPRGIEALVGSDLPAAAGLGSSSALVVACALALLAAAGESVPPPELAARLAEAERFTGTRGGGMDQTICLCAREGTASLIEFAPSRVEPVAVPDDWRFVVAHSLAEARKSGAAQTTYNRRRAEVESALREADGRELGPDIGRRYKHVVTEAARVRQAVEAMKAVHMSAFGTLMTASHRSLRDDFEVSTPELDELVGIALDAGAAGARLTGAGLGGSVVALVGAARCAAVMDALADRFYARRMSIEPSAATAGSRAVDDVLFVAHPAAAASVRRIESARRG